MAKRKPFLNDKKASASLLKALDKARNTVVTDEMLKEQRVSFAYGNAMHQKTITKDSVRMSSKSVRLRSAKS